MQQLRLKIAYLLHYRLKNRNNSDLSISESEDKKETVNYSLHNDVCKSKDTSGCQTQLKRLHKSTNDSEVFAAPNKRIKIGKSGTLAETEILKQPNDNDTYEVEESHGTDDIKDYSDDGQIVCFNKKDEGGLCNGTHETQVSEGGEADLHKHRVGCKKNPGHTKFVPVNDFNINHLPEGHHDNVLVELIKATADLTVRVAVQMTSPERPEFWPDTTLPYAFYDIRESDVMKVGTGMVVDVSKLTEESIKKFKLGTCPCHKCEHSDTPSKVWGEVQMGTARHVVFDDFEARHTTCRLFFDRQDSPLVTLDGWTVEESNTAADWCKLKCVTCDVDSLDKLDKMLINWDDIGEQVQNKYMSSRDKDKLAFIVSHPHGCPKQISVGHWINRYELYDHGEDASDSKYTYNTSTCPGSSGARVHPLRYDDDWPSGHHVHSGVNSEGNNYSGYGRVYHS